MDSATKNFLILVGAIAVLAIVNTTWAFNVALFVGVLLIFHALSKGLANG